MKRKEIIWMLLPCLFLALAGFVLRGRQLPPLPWDEAFAVVVEKAEKERLSPREVADGWDTKLKITLTHKGRAPQWWGQSIDGHGSSESVRLFYEYQGQQSNVTVPRDKRAVGKGDSLLWRPQWDAKSQRYIARLLLPLAKVPPRPGGVRVQARLAFEQKAKPLCPPARLEHLVRRPGEKIKVPTVSKNPYLRLEKVIVQDVPPAERKADGARGYALGDTRVLWQVRRLDTNENVRYVANVDAQVYDERGVAYSGAGVSTGGEEMSAKNPSATSRADFNLQSIPRRAGALTLRGKLGIGSHWPLPVEVPLRDKQGRILRTPQAPPPFRITTIEVRPADAGLQKAYGTDTVVAFRLQFTQPQKNLAHEDWQNDWSPHLVDDTGKEYWLFKVPGPAGPQPLGGSVSYTPIYKYQYGIEYYIPLSQVSPRARTVKFKAQIGYNNSQRVPVEILLRKRGQPRLTSPEPWS